jgi:hypothetical protein
MRGDKMEKCKCGNSIKNCFNWGEERKGFITYECAVCHEIFEIKER